MTAYYNENDPEAVAALRQLIADGVIASGEVDPRSIKDVTADDLRGFTQCHFFAGAGLWSVAARLAGWPDGRRLWTASCPCQPFSSAGARLGADDPRHLWPDLYRILSSSRAAGYGPPVLVGEQIAGTAGYGWFDGVRADLAREEIAGRTVDIPACAIDAPHERNRLWWLAVANAEGGSSGTGLCEDGTKRHWPVIADGHGGDIVLADSESFRGGREQPQRRSEGRTFDGRANAGSVPMVHAAGERRGQGSAAADVLRRRAALASPDLRQRNGSWWADAAWIECHDGKARRAKPSIPMLVNGMVGRASVWRLAGNSIVPQLAAEVIAAFLDAEADMNFAATR